MIDDVGSIVNTETNYNRHGRVPKAPRNAEINLETKPKV